MLFFIKAMDRTGTGMRQKWRAAHLDFVTTCRERFKYGGPLIDDGGAVVGSIMVLELPDRAALEAHMAKDPYFREPVFESVEIFQTRQIVPETVPGSLDAELAKQRASEIA